MIVILKYSCFSAGYAIKFVVSAFLPFWYFSVCLMS